MGRGPDPEALDTFELELRKIPGVVGVGFSGEGADLSVHLVVAASTEATRVRTEADGLVQLYLEQPVSFVIGPSVGRDDEPRVTTRRGVPEGESRGEAARPAPLGRSGPRVQLVGVLRTGGEVEVGLAFRGERVTGREKVGSPVAPAVATLAALRALGWTVPFSVRSAVRLAFGVEGAVVVMLTSSNEERLGIGRSPRPEEATVKATLHALNRTLAHELPESA